ncbi:MAG: hypothetical protein ACRC35_13840 [Angustibacter sp.]
MTRGTPTAAERRGLGGRLWRVARTASAAAAGVRLAATVLAVAPPGGVARWSRINHRGETVTLLEGPAFVVGAAVGLGATSTLTARQRNAALVATVAAGLVGAYDDFADGQQAKGLSGHLGALKDGVITSGAVKVVGLAASGVLAAAVAGPSRRVAAKPVAPASRRVRGSVVDSVLGGAVVAGTANLVNLLDLRPGRALKVVVATAPAAFGAGPAAVVLPAAVGAAAASLPDDLAERTMLGDTGANCAGALLGTAAVLRWGRGGQVVALAAVVALTLVSERVSFTTVIERTAILRDLDRLGRRP